MNNILTGTALTTFCETWSFSELSTLRMFVDGAMKNDQDSVASATGLTEA